MTNKFTLNTSMMALAFMVGTFSFSTFSAAHAADKPVLVITNKDMGTQNTSIRSARNIPSAASRVSTQVSSTRPSSVYNRPSVAPTITAEQITGAAYFEGDNTIVGKQVSDLTKDLANMKSKVNRMGEQLNAIQQKGRNGAAAYYASIATINTQLQTGTTPGNPRLVKRLNTAQQNLDLLGKNVSELNNLGVEVADTASKGAFLLDQSRSAYSVSGAVEEDHVRLAMLEDDINSAMVTVNRLLNNVSDDISRTTSYLSTEQQNLRTLALAVSDGRLYGKNLANYPFSRAEQSPMVQQASFGGAAQQDFTPAPAPQNLNATNFGPASSVGAPRPLAKIRFDKPNVDFEQPIYVAIQNALQQYPDARFELIAVHPTSGNPAQVAIESTRSRRNAERVLRTLTQIGIDLNRIDLSYAPSNDAQNSEVHIFLR